MRIWAIAVAPAGDAAALAATYPGITFLADPELIAVRAFAVQHPGDAMPGDPREIAYPTTFLIDAAAKIRFAHRPPRIMERLDVDSLLATIDGLLSRRG